MIVLTSDQGFYLGDHGFYDKRFIYEESLRMPFMIKFPKKIKAGTENEDIISNVDFAPTMLEVAGIKTTQPMQGKSFVPMFDGKAPKDWRQSMYYHYYEWPFWHHVQPHYGIRTARYTLAHFYYNIDKWEFYDNKKDPEQVYNAIADPRYTAIIADLKSQLKQLQKTYGDDKGLEEFRKITDMDFGRLNGTEGGEENVEDIINSGESKP